jgi:hypothetical protein
MGAISAGYGNMVGDKGDRALNSLDAGDWLIAYSKGNGAVGAGIVGASETYRLLRDADLPLGYEQPQHRHLRDVQWVYFVEDIGGAVSYRDLQVKSQLRTTKNEVKDKENARRIIELLAAKTPLKYQIFPDDIQTGSTLSEGALQQVTVNRYERNPEARRRCIEHWGVACSVCEMSFAERYGSYAKDFIHVHHVRPISQLGGEYHVDPIKDLRPVCPNCHAMLHYGQPVLSIEELRNRVTSKT